MFLTTFIKSVKTKIWSFIVMAHVMTVSNPALAKIQQTTMPDGSTASGNFFADLKKIIKAIAELLIYGIYILMFVYAVWMIIQGIIEGRKKGEWGNLIISVIVAFVLILIGGYFLFQGETALTNLD